MERAIYRIIDANFNRCREALRVMEEFCRFGLDNRSLSGRAKQLRHRLCGAVSKIDADTLINCRDSAGDVGSDIKVVGQLKRVDLKSCFVAACKRASEALRALAETSQMIEPEVHAECEKLRFDVYTLEKDVLAASRAFDRLSGMRLYVLVTVEAGFDEAEILKIVQQCAAGGADCIQLRCKGLDDKSMVGLGSQFVDVCKEAGVLSIVNDRADIAIACGADGVHLGKEDLSIEHVRRLGTKPLIVGLTTHNLGELDEAIAAGADYVGLGPAFATATKPSLNAAGLGYIEQAVKRLDGSGVWHVAIGGINESNIESVLQAGAGAVAVCGAVTKADDVVNACQQLKGCF